MRDRTEPSPTSDARCDAPQAADLLGHVLLFARRHELDLAAAIRRKWRFEP